MRNPYISDCAENHGTLQDLNYVAPILSGGNLLCRNFTVWRQGVACSVHDLSGLNQASAEKPSARHRLDDVHFGGSRVHLIEAEPAPASRSRYSGIVRSLPPVRTTSRRQSAGGSAKPKNTRVDAILGTARRQLLGLCARSQQSSCKIGFIRRPTR